MIPSAVSTFTDLVYVTVFIYVIQSKILPALGNTHFQNADLIVGGVYICKCRLAGTEEMNTVIVEKNVSIINIF